MLIHNMCVSSEADKIRGTFGEALGGGIGESLLSPEL
jgi:hypothetical protein